MKKQRSMIITILIGTLILLAGFTSRVWMASGTGNAAMAPQSSQGLPFTLSNPPREDAKILGLLRRGALPFTLQQALQTMGNRLEVKGRERATISGTLRSEGNLQETAFTLIAELPKRLRLTLSNGSGNRVFIADGQAIRSNNALSQRDYDLIETLIYDTTEHLLLEYDSGALAMRYLGGHFRKSDNLAETPYDIFEASETLSLGESSRKQIKHYSFNSQTWLLERITYSRLVNNQLLEVEVQMSNWQLIDGQKVATTIERFENKTSVFKVTFNSVQYSAPLNDGIF
jgi:hypothetical protein